MAYDVPLNELAAKLAIDDFEERRAELRKLAMPTLERGLTKGKIEEAYTISPLVGDSPEQVAPRSSVSGLRDMLDEDTLVAVITEFIQPEDILGAIVAPEEKGVRSSRSKTGFLFGRPLTVNDRYLLDMRDHLKHHFASSTPTKGESPMSTTPTIDKFYADASLDDLCLIVGVCLSRLGGLVSADQVIEAAKQLSRCDRFDAVASLVSSGSELPVRDVDGAIELAIDAICKRLTDDDKPEDDKPVEAVAAKYAAPDPAKSALIDLTLSQAGLPAIATLLDELNDASRRIMEAESRAKTMVLPTIEVEAKGDGTIPRGTVKLVRAYDVFGITRAGRDAFDFDVPTWTWGDVHPHVPAIDADYIFRPFDLLRCLYGIVTNQRTYLQGHTGSGKSTLVEQIAARLNWPYMRVNFDSEITRMDLIGRDVLTNEGGVTTSKFVDGILPQMMSGPYIGCFDEMDFVRPDVAYVMQRALEGGGLMLTEDGGRIVKPHRMFRIFATGNTVGQGDEFGMYQGARPQSLALLDRFTVWVKVDYLNTTERKRLIKARVPALSEEMLNSVNKYVTEHLEAFLSSKVLQPISPRGMIALSQSLVTFTAWLGEKRKREAVEQAFKTTILDRATAQDRVVLTGIVDRVFA